jgi:hypothetical protein
LSVESSSDKEKEILSNLFEGANVGWAQPSSRSRLTWCEQPPQHDTESSK